MATQYRAMIQDDNGDVTYGPAESEQAAQKRLDDAMTSPWNIGGEIQEVK